jgi:GWxTD domain-containing protein
MRGAPSPGAWFPPLIVMLLWAGCSGRQALEQAVDGTSSSYKPGSPGFDIETAEVQGDTLSAVDLYLSVPFPSLIFEKSGDGFRSRCEITARLTDREDQLTGEVAWAETTYVDRYESTQSPDPRIFRRRITAPPGNYRILVTIEDLVDGRKAAKAQSVKIFDPADAGPALGRIALMARMRDGTRLPQISFYVPLRGDSGSCTIGAYNFPSADDSRIDMRVLRFGVDTSVAVAPFYFTVMTASVNRTQVDFEKPDTPFTAARIFRPARREESLEFRIPPLRQALYRFDFMATTRTRGGGDTAFSAGRYYSVQGPGFPRPVTFGELIESAVYLANEKEMRVLRSAATPEEQRKRFEDFWLSLAGDPARASTVIKKYYGRVEEANRLFTVAREGWRSDRGMLYCILGPPSEITNRLDVQTWYYDLSGNANENAFAFKRIVRSHAGLTVEDFLLYRQAGYEPFWERILSRWRNGYPP